MKIGLALHPGMGLQSVNTVAHAIRDAISQQHELLTFSLDDAFERPGPRTQRSVDIVNRSDVLVGFHSTIEPLLDARRRIPKSIGCLIFALGAFPRGALTIRRLLPLLSPRDIIAVSCTADVAIGRRMFPSARIELIPFAVDRSVFSEASAEQRLDCRDELRIPQYSKVLLYAGRQNVQKNIHTLFSVFRIALSCDPQSYLLLAGRSDDTPFQEGGVAPVNYARSLERLAAMLEIPQDRIIRTSANTANALGRVYSAADVLVNLTLNHDENFGLAQAEAICCGTPVIASAWGGLNDVVQEGVNGHKVSVVVTPSGLKVNWWEAANLVVITGEEMRAGVLSRNVVAASGERFLPSRFSTKLLQCIGLLAGEAQDWSLFEPSAFAKTLWEHCAPSGSAFLRCSPSPESFRTYLDHIALYAGGSARHVPLDTPLVQDDLLILPSPTSVQEHLCRIDDPLYPTSLAVPDVLADTVGRAVLYLTRSPVIEVRELAKNLAVESEEAYEALTWMASSGILLRSRGEDAVLTPSVADHRIGHSRFSMQRVRLSSTDFLTYE